MHAYLCKTQKSFGTSCFSSCLAFPALTPHNGILQRLSHVHHDRFIENLRQVVIFVNHMVSEHLDNPVTHRKLQPVCMQCIMYISRVGCRISSSSSNQMNVFTPWSLS